MYFYTLCLEPQLLRHVVGKPKTIELYIWLLNTSSVYTLIIVTQGMSEKKITSITYSLIPKVNLVKYFKMLCSLKDFFKKTQKNQKNPPFKREHI